MESRASTVPLRAAPSLRTPSAVESTPKIFWNTSSSIMLTCTPSPSHAPPQDTGSHARLRAWTHKGAAASSKNKTFMLRTAATLSRPGFVKSSLDVHSASKSNVLCRVEALISVPSISMLAAAWRKDRAHTRDNQ